MFLGPSDALVTLVGGVITKKMHKLVRFAGHSAQAPSPCLPIKPYNMN